MHTGQSYLTRPGVVNVVHNDPQETTGIHIYRECYKYWTKIDSHGKIHPQAKLIRS